MAIQKQYYRRKKVCKFCVERIDSINYKDVKLLSQFVPERAECQVTRTIRQKAAEDAALRSS